MAAQALASTCQRRGSPRRPPSRVLRDVAGRLKIFNGGRYIGEGKPGLGQEAVGGAGGRLARSASCE